MTEPKIELLSTARKFAQEEKRVYAVIVGGQHHHLLTGKGCLAFWPVLTIQVSSGMFHVNAALIVPIR